MVRLKTRRPSPTGSSVRSSSRARPGFAAGWTRIRTSARGSDPSPRASTKTATSSFLPYTRLGPSGNSPAGEVQSRPLFGFPNTNALMDGPVAKGTSVAGCAAVLPAIEAGHDVAQPGVDRVGQFLVQRIAFGHPPGMVVDPESAGHQAEIAPPAAELGVGPIGREAEPGAEVQAQARLRASVGARRAPSA